MKLSNDVFANIINTLKCINELQQKNKDTEDMLISCINEIDVLNNMFDYFDGLTYLERKTIRDGMKNKGKEFLELSYRLINIRLKIDELKKRVTNYLF